MGITEPMISASIPALVALATITLSNRHTLRVMRADQEASRKSAEDERRWNRAEAERLAALAEETKTAERKRERIANALIELGRVQGELIGSTAGGLKPVGSPVTRETLAACSTSLNLALLDYPHGWLMQDVNLMLESIKSARAADTVLSEVQELAQSLVELSNGAPVSWEDPAND